MRRFVIPLTFLGLVFTLAACNSALNGSDPGLQPQNGVKGPLYIQKTAVPGNPSGSWNLTKTAFDAQGSPVSSITVTPGSSTTLSYTVQATFTPSGGSYSVSGVVTVQNTTPGSPTSPPPPASVTEPVDTLPVSGTDVNIPLSCTDPSGNPITAWPYGLAYNATMTCTYDYTFTGTPPLPPLGTTLTNSVTDSGVWSDGTTYSGGATADFSFSSAPAGSAGNIKINDNVTCPTGFTCTKSNESTTGQGTDTVTYTYDLQVTAGGSVQCGQHFTLDNVASIKGTSVTASSTVDVYTGDCTPPPSQGCTLTQGYWKTHSSYGPATPSNATWDSVGGPDAIFYNSGMSWIQLFDTAPKGGNAYIQLAHQFMAATLNINAGASEPADVQQAMTWAEAFFSATNPENSPESYTDGAMANQYASVLDNYNNGKDGVPACGTTSTCKTSTSWSSNNGFNKGGTTGDTSCNTSCTSQSGWLSAQGYNKGGSSGGTSCDTSCTSQSGWLSAQGYNKGGSSGGTSCDTSCTSQSGWLSAQGYNKGGSTGSTSCNPSPCTYQTSGLSLLGYNKGGTSTSGCSTGGNDNNSNSWSQGSSGKGW